MVFPSNVLQAKPINCTTLYYHRLPTYLLRLLLDGLPGKVLGARDQGLGEVRGGVGRLFVQ